MKKTVTKYAIIFKDIYGSLNEPDWDILKNVERRYAFLSLKKVREYGIVDYWIVQKQFEIDSSGREG